MGQRLHQRLQETGDSSRKGGRFKYLEEYELDLQQSERWRMYATQHEELWIDFTEDAVRRAGMTELLDADGLTKHKFANELKDLE